MLQGRGWDGEAHQSSSLVARLACSPPDGGWGRGFEDSSPRERAVPPTPLPQASPTVPMLS